MGVSVFVLAMMLHIIWAMVTLNEVSVKSVKQVTLVSTAASLINKENKQRNP